MGCCKCEEHKWDDPQDVVWKDPADGKEYCVFHAPKEQKWKRPVGQEQYTISEFNKLVFSIINGTIDKIVAGDSDAVCCLSGTIFPGDIFFEPGKTHSQLPFLDMSSATFCGQALFVRVTFGSGVLFEDTTFSCRVVFARTTFKDLALFTRTTFKSSTLFVGAVFSDCVQFIDCQARDRSIQMRFISKKSLENLAFASHELHAFSFLQCDWPQHLGMGNNGIRTINASKVCEELYRSMKQRAMEEHDQLMVSRWHYCEKVMRLTQQNGKLYKISLLQKYKEGRTRSLLRRCWLRFKLITPIMLRSLTWWYWATSGFGERAVRAGVWLLALLLLPFLANSTLATWLSSLWAAMPWATPLSAAAGWVQNSVNATAAVGFIPFMKDVGGTDGWIKVGQALWQGVIVLQSTLFALAVRNRFRR